MRWVVGSTGLRAFVDTHARKAPRIPCNQGQPLKNSRRRMRCLRVFSNAFRSRPRPVCSPRLSFSIARFFPAFFSPPLPGFTSPSSFSNRHAPRLDSVLSCIIFNKCCCSNRRILPSESRCFSLPGASLRPSKLSPRAFAEIPVGGYNGRLGRVRFSRQPRIAPATIRVFAA